MKKIMFNDRYGLTEAVLKGRKTQTRRVVDVACEQPLIQAEELSKHAKYKIGEVIAIAQDYLSINNPQFSGKGYDTPGNTNKLFVKAELMPHQIRIVNIRVERIQDISIEDCIKEGIIELDEKCEFGKMYVISEEYTQIFLNPKRAYEDLVTKVMGRETWSRNPWVYVYEFELYR